MKFCTHCGAQLNDTAAFCSSCGTPCNGTAQTAQQPQNEETLSQVLSNSVNNLTGGKAVKRPPLGTLFAQTFKSHSREESETIFACGTPSTTPRLTSAQTAWPQPWLWARVLVAFGIAFLLMALCVETFENGNAYPGVILFGSFMMPVAVMIFCFELNTPKNISFYNVLKIFLVGGAASLLVTCILYEIIEVGELDYAGACLVSFIEETAKVVITAFFLYREKDAKYYVNGLLIGAAVGAGFGALESAGYAFRVLLADGTDRMMDVIWLRAYLAPGMHVAWAALTGYGISLALKGGTFSATFLSKAAFWKVAAIALVLHAVWDMPIELGGEIPVVQLILTVLAWVALFACIGNSLTQLTELVAQNTEEPETVTQ